MGGASGRGRRRGGNGSGKSEEIKEDLLGSRRRGVRNRPRKGNDGFGSGGFVQSLFVEGGSLAEWQPVNNLPSGNRRMTMSRPAVQVVRPNVNRVQSTLRGGGRQGPKGSPHGRDVSGKMNNAIGYTYPDPETTDYPPAVGLVTDGSDIDPNKSPISNSIFSTSETEARKSESSHHFSPATVLPPSETRVAVLLDRNPKGPALESVRYDESTYDVLGGESSMGLGYNVEGTIFMQVGNLNKECEVKPSDACKTGESSMGLGYNVEGTISTQVGYLNKECEVKAGDGCKTVNSANDIIPGEADNTKQRQKTQEMYNWMNKQVSRRRYEMQDKGNKGKNVVSNRNEGFLVIGGVRVYTDVVSVSSEDDSAMAETDTEDNAESPDRSNGVRISRSKFPATECCSTSNLSESGEDSEDSEARSSSDIDDEIVKDYLEGIGGSVTELLDAEWLLDRGALELVPPEEISEDYKEDAVDYESSSEESSDEGEDGEPTLSNLTMKSGLQICRSKTLTGNKMSELEVEQLRENILFDENSGNISRAERGRGFKKRDAHCPQSVDCPDNVERDLESLLLSKDVRTPSIRKKDKSIRVAQTWPVDARKMKCKGIPGGKKKHRKEEIAAKRRERALRRGVDLETINTSLERMVLDAVDVLAFQPMHSRDCSQVQRLASIYHLTSGRQGSGKKRFVTVARTKHTCMPSANDRMRLLKLLGRDDEMLESGFKSSSSRGKLSGEKSQMDTKVRHAARMAYMSMVHGESFSPKFRKRPSKVACVLSDTAGGSGKKKMSATRRERKCVTGYANQPMSFVSSGTMEPDCAIVEKGVSIISFAEEENSASQNGVSVEGKRTGSSSKMGSFEVHTKGFGSRMMAKMGFVEGTGLGKDGQGIVEPLEAVKRPKSLGLGL